MPLTSNRFKVVVSAPSLGNVSLPVPQIAQEQTQWCWAACADMVVHYYGNTAARQCEFANWLFGQSNCCASPGSSACNRPCQINDVSRVFSRWGIRSNYSGGSVSFGTLRSEVDSSRPVEVGYAWNGGGGHVALVTGWIVVSGGNALRVNDPAYGSGGVYYNKLLTAYDMGQWRWTWTGIRR